jgi:hypothetical protein
MACQLLCCFLLLLQNTAAGNGLPPSFAAPAAPPRAAPGQDVNGNADLVKLVKGWLKDVYDMAGWETVEEVLAWLQSHGVRFWKRGSDGTMYFKAGSKTLYGRHAVAAHLGLVSGKSTAFQCQ